MEGDTHAMPTARDARARELTSIRGRGLGDFLTFLKMGNTSGDLGADGTSVTLRVTGSWVSCCWEFCSLFSIVVSFTINWALLSILEASFISIFLPDS